MMDSGLDEGRGGKSTVISGKGDPGPDATTPPPRPWLRQVRHQKLDTASAATCVRAGHEPVAAGAPAWRRHSGRWVHLDTALKLETVTLVAATFASTMINPTCHQKSPLAYVAMIR